MIRTASRYRPMTLMHSRKLERVIVWGVCCLTNDASARVYSSAAVHFAKETPIRIALSTCEAASPASEKTLLASGGASLVAGTMMRTCRAARLTCEAAGAISKERLQIGEIIRQAATVALQVRGNDFQPAKAAAKHRKAALQACCLILLI